MGASIKNQEYYEWEKKMKVKPIHMMINKIYNKGQNRDQYDRSIGERKYLRFSLSISFNFKKSHDFILLNVWMIYDDIGLPVLIFFSGLILLTNKKYKNRIYPLVVPGYRKHFYCVCVCVEMNWKVSNAKKKRIGNSPWKKYIYDIHKIPKFILFLFLQFDWRKPKPKPKLLPNNIENRFLPLSYLVWRQREREQKK